MVEQDIKFTKSRSPSVKCRFMAKIALGHRQIEIFGIILSHLDDEFPIAISKKRPDFFYGTIRPKLVPATFLAAQPKFDMAQPIATIHPANATTHGLIDF